MRHILGLCLVLTIAACGSAAKQSTRYDARADLQGAPSWILSNTCPETAVCGVDGASGADISTNRANAITRAQSQIATAFGVAMKSMVEDVRITRSQLDADPAKRKSESMQSVERGLEALTNVKLTGAQFSEGWLAPSGEFWALVKLDAKSFGNFLDQAQLDKPTLEYLQQNHERVMKKMRDAISGSN